jgi:hypothetical protein
MSTNDENLEEKERLLSLAASKAAKRPFFLAAALETYKHIENLDENGLAEVLKLEVGQLSRLGLCRRPDVNNSQTFRRDIEAISQKFGLAPALLGNLLRRVAAYEAKQTDPPGFLMAARDRTEEDEGQADE